MIYYAILNLKTNTLFPFIARGSSWYDFKENNKPQPPRLFRKRHNALSYLTVYLKGPFQYDEEGNKIRIKTAVLRLREDFRIVTINLEIIND